MDLFPSGKRAVVTGGSRGIAFAIADALSAEVAEIALLARDVVTFLASPRSVAVDGEGDRRRRRHPRPYPLLTTAPPGFREPAEYPSAYSR